MAVNILPKPLRRSSTANSAKSKSGSRKPIRRALIVGIDYHSMSGPEQTLRTPHKDALAWRQVLIEKYGYPESGIKVMLDDEHTTPEMLPTRENLLREISALVAGARSGDRFMFYYSGHSTQLESTSPDEEDGFDEAIIPFDPSASPKAEPIVDDELRERLVEPLPIGSSLTAIFDSCHSGTMLDLDHYACNLVYFPWCNKGLRDISSKRRAVVVRRNGVDGLDENVVKLKLGDATSVAGSVDSAGTKVSDVKFLARVCERKRSKKGLICKRDLIIKDIPAEGEKERRRFVVTRSSTMEVPRHSSNKAPKKPRRGFSFHEFSFSDFFIKKTAEPESMVPCDGWCKPSKKKTKAHVISVSACQDPQRTWEGKKGFTMTQSMISILNKVPNLPIRRLVTLVGHDLHRRTTLRLHEFGQVKMEKWRAKGSPVDERPDVEVVNGTDPQIGSMNPLREDEGLPL